MTRFWSMKPTMPSCCNTGQPFFYENGINTGSYGHYNPFALQLFLGLGGTRFFHTDLFAQEFFPVKILNRRLSMGLLCHFYKSEPPGWPLYLSLMTLADFTWPKDSKASRIYHPLLHMISFLYKYS